MKNHAIILLLISFFFYEPDLVSKVDIKKMFEGMGTTFGAPPVGYTYSFAIISDASVPIYVQQQGIASFMGAFFPSVKGYYGEKTLQSIFDSRGKISRVDYNKEDYYFKFYISANSQAHKDAIYTQPVMQLPLEKHDPNVYYYHVYTGHTYHKSNLVHEPKVEQMGYQNPSKIDSLKESEKGNVKFSSQLSDLAFYNSSGIDVQVSLTYGLDPYTFTLEKYSYNSLGLPTPEEKVKKEGDTISLADADDTPTAKNKEEAPAFSLRPNTLFFSTYNLTTQDHDVFRSFSLPTQSFEGYACTIEIFQDKGKPLEVGIQGFNPGNYDLAVTSRVRDLTPCPSTFWYKSFEQDGSIEGYSNLPGQIWVAYGGADSQFQLKVEPGQSVSWNLIRPLVDQADQFVYFLYVVTTDDAVAQKFVQKVVNQKLGKNVVYEYEKAIQSPIATSKLTVIDNDNNDRDEFSLEAAPSISVDQEVATLMGNLSVADGVIEDVEQKVIGYLVGTDVFTPKGMGFGRFYYVLSPSIVSVSNIVSFLYGCLDSSKLSGLGSSDADIQESLTALIKDWLTLYIKNPDDVQKKVEEYLQQYGNSKIVDVTNGQLTKFGKNRLQQIMSGNVSLKYPSMKLSTVTNQYVFDFGRSAPKEMPNPLQIKRKILSEKTQLKEQRVEKRAEKRNDKLYKEPGASRRKA